MINPQQGPSLADLLKQYTNALNEEHRRKLEELQSVFSQQGIGNQFGTLGGRPAQAAPKWNNIAEMNAALAAQRERGAKAKKQAELDKPKRIEEIEHELDIIRGRVPTPKGYTIQPSKVKALLKELQELKS